MRYRELEKLVPMWSFVYITGNVAFVDLPQFVHIPTDAHVKEGTELKLSCLANARPYPAILWYNEAKGIYYGIGMRYGTLRIERHDRTISLIISPVKKSDEGTYTCKATNAIGTAKHDVKVLVHSVSENAPNITGRTDGNLKVADINSNITFICDINGNPKPSVSWFKVGHDGTLGDGIILKNFPLGEMHRYVLNIERVQESDAGIFQCQAVNKINTATKTFVLHVTSKYFISYIPLIVYYCTSMHVHCTWSFCRNIT